MVDAHFPTESSSTASCPTCGTPRRGPFCHQCGQRFAEGRLTLAGLWRQLPARLFNLDRGLLHTFIELFKRPGGVPRDYVAGRRSPYTNPLTYFLVAATVQLISLTLREQVLHQHLMEQFGRHPDAIARLAQIFGENPVQKMADLYIRLIKQGYTYLFLLCMSLPFAVYVRLLAFRLRPKYNLAESAVFALYTSAHFVLVTGLILPFTLYFGTQLHALASFAVYIVYTAFAARGFYDGGRGRVALVTAAVIGAFLTFITCLVVIFIGLIMARQGAPV